MLWDSGSFGFFLGKTQKCIHIYKHRYKPSTSLFTVLPLWVKHLYNKVTHSFQTSTLSEDVLYLKFSSLVLHWDYKPNIINKYWNSIVYLNHCTHASNVLKLTKRQDILVVCDIIWYYTNGQKFLLSSYASIYAICYFVHILLHVLTDWLHQGWREVFL